MTIEQIRVGFDNFCYLIFCQRKKKAAFVDPGYNYTDLIKLISKKDLILDYIIATHYHFDHTGCINQIKKTYPNSKIIASELDGSQLDAKVDIKVSDNENIRLGDINLKFILTPGHTPGGICIIVDNESLLTGDTLFIGDCGRTDLLGGSLNQMFKTLQEKIMPLPDNLIVYPGHNYGDKPFDSLGNQKKTNKTLLAKNIKEFSKIT